MNGNKEKAQSKPLIIYCQVPEVLQIDPNNKFLMPPLFWLCLVSQ